MAAVMVVRLYEETRTEVAAKPATFTACYRNSNPAALIVHTRDSGYSGFSPKWRQTDVCDMRFTDDRQIP
jgi:hypothetical protein